MPRTPQDDSQPFPQGGGGISRKASPKQLHGEDNATLVDVLSHTSNKYAGGEGVVGYPQQLAITEVATSSMMRLEGYSIKSLL